MRDGWEMRRDFVSTNDKSQKSSERRSLAGGSSQAAEYEWIRKPPIQLLPDAVPYAMAKLRAYGNAIVPQVAAEFIMALSD
jgi:hypothetical protein